MKDDNLAEVLEQVKKRPRPTTPFGQRASLRAVQKTQMIHDTNPGESQNPNFARVIRLQCTVCGCQWSACYEGPEIRHREDLICYKCANR